MDLPNSPTPDISSEDVYIIRNTMPITNFLGGIPDDIRYFIFGLDSVIESNTNIKLQGGEDFQGTVGDTITLLYDGVKWVEITRSLNPMYFGESLDSFSLDADLILQEIHNIKAEMVIIQQQLSKVATIYNDTLLTITSVMSGTEIQQNIDNLYKHIVDNATVTINFESGNYDLDQPIIIRGINGDGKIKITSDDNGFETSKNIVLSSVISKTAVLQIINCSIPIEISNIQFDYQLDNINVYNGGIEIENSRFVDLKNICVNSNNDIGSDIYFNNSDGGVFETYVNYGNIGICADEMSNIVTESCVQQINKPNYGLFSKKGSVITLFNGIQPTGTISDNEIIKGGRINA